MESSPPQAPRKNDNTKIIITIIAIVIVIVIIVLIYSNRSNFTCSNTPKYTANDAYTILNNESNLVDNGMMSTYAAYRSYSIAQGDSYPLGVYDDNTRLFRFKISKSSSEIVFDTMPNTIILIWNWGKSIAHLIVWITAIIKLNINKQSILKYVSNQIDYNIKLLSNLDTMKTYLNSINNKLPDTTATNNANVIITDVDKMINSAKYIITKCDTWCKSITSDTDTVSTNIAADIAEPVGVLMNATIAIVAQRTVNGLLQIKKQMGDTIWDKIRIVETRMIIDPIKSVDKNPRGSNKFTSNTSAVIRSVMSESNYKHKHFVFVTNNTSWEAMELITSEGPFAAYLGSLLGNGYYGSHLAFNCRDPTSAFYPDITYDTSRTQALTDTEPVISEPMCPFANISSKSRCPFS